MIEKLVEICDEAEKLFKDKNYKLDPIIRIAHEPIFALLYPGMNPIGALRLLRKDSNLESVLYMALNFSYLFGASVGECSKNLEGNLEVPIKKVMNLYSVYVSTEGLTSEGYFSLFHVQNGMSPISFYSSNFIQSELYKNAKKSRLNRYSSFNKIADYGFFLGFKIGESFPSHFAYLRNAFALQNDDVPVNIIFSTQSAKNSFPIKSVKIING